MINIRDLKIGSYLKCKVSNDAAAYSVIAIDGWHQKVMLSDVRMGTWYTVDKLKPIPLSEEILLDNEFAKKDKDQTLGVIYERVYTREFDKDDVRVFVGKLQSDPKKMWYFGTGFSAINNIYYVHELQKFLDAATRNTLDINLYTILRKISPSISK